MALTPEKITATWKDTLKIKEEVVNKDGSIIEDGLRTPQIGAFYSILAHWSVSKSHAIIVMPTGTGKTDTMITTMVGNLCSKILIIVPSKTLRSQIGQKFEKLGILSSLKLIKSSAVPPKVGYLKKGLKTLAEIDSYFNDFNVIIATASLFKTIDEGHLIRLASICSHLFLDEAHHSQAPKTWRRIQEAFKNKPSLLFTATPFRNDELPLYGEVIYNYPLSKAQKEGYFTEIEQYPIYEDNPHLADELIAQKAVEILETDLIKFPRHLLMVRANTIARAETIYNIYNKKYPKHNPILIHSNMAESRRKELQSRFERGESKIAVCVDMFGEGYDLPEIKIGAFHDMRKNLTTALQLIGRFTRTKKNLGTAKFVYNAAEEHSAKEIQRLIEEDSNWNLLIPNLTAGKSKRRQELNTFVKTFKSPNNIPLHNLRPALSFVAYKASQEDWTPENFQSYFRSNNLVFLNDLSNRENTLVIIAAEKIPLQWIKSQDYFDVQHHLYVIHWLKKEKILLIHSSKTQGNYYKSLATSLIGDNCKLLKGEVVYRSLHQIERLKFHNLGLQEPHGINVSYTQRAGKNVTSGTSATDLINRGKRLLQGTGYKYGNPISFGVTSKGRIWSLQRGDLAEVIGWTKEVALNIIDESIDTSSFIKHVSTLETISVRPDLRPFYIEWPFTIYINNYLAYSLSTEYDKFYYLHDIDIQLNNPSSTGTIRFNMVTVDFITTYDLTLKNEGFEIVQSAGPKLYINNPNKVYFLDWLNENPPTIYFVDGSYLTDGNQYVKLGQKLRQFDFSKIMTREWQKQGVNIRKESKGLNNIEYTSIQYLLIEELKLLDYDLIFNDDDKEETADIVAIKTNDNTLEIFIEFYHCKYSSKDYTGCRLGDLYEVLGQAQKNIRWLDDITSFFKRLIAREEQLLKKLPLCSRIEKGSINDLRVLTNKVKRDYLVSTKIFAVQPGLSKQDFINRSKSKNEVERLFAVTEDYIKATKQGDFFIICSP